MKTEVTHVKKRSKLDKVLDKVKLFFLGILRV